MLTCLFFFFLIKDCYPNINHMSISQMTFLPLLIPWVKKRCIDRNIICAKSLTYPFMSNAHLVVVCQQTDNSLNHCQSQSLDKGLLNSLNSGCHSNSQLAALTWKKKHNKASETRASYCISMPRTTIYIIQSAVQGLALFKATVIHPSPRQSHKALPLLLDYPRKCISHSVSCEP